APFLDGAGNDVSVVRTGHCKAPQRFPGICVICVTTVIQIVADGTRSSLKFLAPGRRELEVVPFCWGLIPSWSKDLRIGASLINARSETITEKPSFRTAFRKRRCLVPASGFYEWIRE